VLNTADKGSRTEAVVLSALAKAGYTVLLPFGNVARYDLAIDDREGGGIRTVQCKTGRLVQSCITFKAYSASPRSPYKTYAGQVDYFGVWCPAVPEDCYLVPVELIGHTEGRLRLEPTKNNQASGIRWAQEFKVKGM